jgi:hypothetical protein
VGDGVGRTGRDPGFELLEVVCDRCLLLACIEAADRFDLKVESTSGQMGAEQKKHGGAGHDCQFGPNRQEAQPAAQQKTSASVRT